MCVDRYKTNMKLSVVLVAAGILCVATTVAVQYFQHVASTRCTRRDTIHRIVHTILAQSHVVSTMDDPGRALVLSRECHASLSTLMLLVDMKTEKVVPYVDFQELQNIIYFQEHQLRVQLELDV